MSQKLRIPIYALKPPEDEPRELDDLETYHFAIGSVLGDGSIIKRDFYMQFEQKSPTLALWKRNFCLKKGLITPRLVLPPREVLKLAHGSLTISLPIRMKKRKSKNSALGASLHPDSAKNYRSFAFNSRAMFHDPRWRSLFYVKEEKGRVKYRKSLPADLKDYFWGDFALAVWFLDDGWYDRRKKTVRFACGEWTRSECDIMVECLKDNLNLDAVVYPLESTKSPTKTPHHFYVKPKCYAEFVKTVEPFLKKLEAEFPKYRQSISMKNKQLP